MGLTLLSQMQGTRDLWSFQTLKNSLLTSRLFAIKSVYSHIFLTIFSFDKCFAINVKTHFVLFKAAKDHLKKNELGGSFIVSASSSGLRPMGSSIAYSVSKAALIHLVKCLAKSQGPNVRVNAVCPGLMLTDVSTRL